MNKVMFALFLSTLLLSSCSSIRQRSSESPLCSRIIQKMGVAPSANSTPGTNGVVTTAEQSRLLKEYNQLGCHENSDNEFRNPNESFPMHEMTDGT